MGSGGWSVKSYTDYSIGSGKTYDTTTGRVTNQVFESKHLDDSLNPRNFEFRECANSEEHPNTIPVILALDVTGSMGKACNETAEALNVIISNLYSKIKDVEFCIMGIGDLAYDDAPIQMSQFESDIRIAEALDKVYMEHGGGGNGFESYTAAWYMGLKRTKLDCFDKQNRKGIIITMGDEPLNPYLPKNKLNHCINAHEEGNIETPKLYEETLKKFDIYHIAINDKESSYSWYERDIKKSFGDLLGDNFKVSTINELASVIEACILKSVNNVEFEQPEEMAFTQGIGW